MKRLYLDLLLLFSLLVNYFLLLLTAKIFRRSPGAGRLLGGAALGAFAVLVLMLPPNHALIVAVILAAPAVMVAAVFWPLRPGELFLLWGALFLCAFMTGGAVLALSAGLGLAAGPPPGAALLCGTCLLLYLFLGLLWPYLEEKRLQKRWRMDLLVSWQGREKTVPAYLDTGNRLRDPFTRRPVIVIDYRSLEGILPPPVYRRLSDPALEPWAALQELEDISQARCFTLVPFSGVGARREILLGFKPDAVVISRGEQSWPVGPRVILGLARRGFGPAAEYRALLPPDLVKAG